MILNLSFTRNTYFEAVWFKENPAGGQMGQTCADLAERLVAVVGNETHSGELVLNCIYVHVSYPHNE